MLFLFFNILSFLLFYLQTECLCKEIGGCQYKNTYRNRYGNCVCKHGYFSDTVIDSRGCWKCIPFCVENAICNYNGSCTCKKGYLGEATEYCTLIEDYPVIIDYFPSSAPRNSQSSVKITLKSEVPSNIFDGYIKIGKYIEMCNISKNIMICTLPKSKKAKKYQLRVSLNGREWSINPVQFEFTEKIKKPKNHIFELYVVITISILSLFSFYLIIKNRKDEFLPKKAN